MKNHPQPEQAEVLPVDWLMLAAAASTSRGSVGVGGGGADPVGGGVVEALSRDIRRDCREAHVTLELHEDGLILC